MTTIYIKECHECEKYANDLHIYLDYKFETSEEYNDYVSKYGPGTTFYFCSEECMQKFKFIYKCDYCCTKHNVIDVKCTVVCPLGNGHNENSTFMCNNCLSSYPNHEQYVKSYSKYYNCIPDKETFAKMQIEKTLKFLDDNDIDYSLLYDKIKENWDENKKL
jgi:hypothetical protein